MSIFVGREDELKVLSDRYGSGRAEFLLLYGRRRVGKSELIERFLSAEGIRGIRISARDESKKLQLEGFARRISEFFGDEFVSKNGFSSWDAFFEYISAKAADERFVLAIDEFPLLVKEDPSLPSIMQDYWDSKMKNGRTFIILCGSSIKMMESLMGYESPLYGRRTGQILLKPLRFDEVFGYVKDFGKAAGMYSVFGGTPAYLMEANVSESVEDNIRKKILPRDSFISNDVEFVLRQELSEPRYYFSILQSIAKGNNSQGLISNDTGLEKSLVNKYISVLIDIQLVRREVPVTESYKAKKSIYILNDMLFEFWFRFVNPNADNIERGNFGAVMENVKSNLNQYMGWHFERISLEILHKVAWNGFTRAGRWWKGDVEIDIMALNESTKEVLFAECKWRDGVDAGSILEKLREKAGKVPWKRGERTERFAIFAKSFGKGKVPPDVELFDIERMGSSLGKA